MPLRDRLPWREQNRKKRKLAPPSKTTASPVAAAEPTAPGATELSGDQNHDAEQHEQSIATSSLSDATTSKDVGLQYWTLAYAALKLRDEVLVFNYERILAKETKSSIQRVSLTARRSGSTEEQADDVPQTPTRDELVKLIDANIQKAESKSRPIELIDKAAKFVTAIKDFATSVASTNPHAALAWAGVSVLLPVRPTVYIVKAI